MAHTEHRKKPGMCYAMTDEGIELPVVDITNPAFAVGVAPNDIPLLIRQSVDSLEKWLRLPVFVRKFVTRRSVLWASGRFIAGMATYLHKLGPNNLDPSYVGRFDRKAAGTIGSVALCLRLRAVARA